MEYVPNTIEQALEIESGGEREQDQLKIITYNLLCAMKYIHSANLIHRDVKPDNVLIDKHCITKFCDFGLSRTVP